MVKGSLVALVPSVGVLGLLAYSGLTTPPPPARTGAPVDGGLSCTACHTGTANSDPRGLLKVEVSHYKPGIRQILRLTLSHPEARRWGFQLTARIVNDETRPAGTFGTTSEVAVICADGRRPPCGTAPEFASHTAASTFDNRSGPVTWEIEWTPPSDDVGDVIFYAAANAANFDKTPQGDWIYTTSVRIENAGGCPLTARRAVIRSVVNGASFSAEAGIGMNSMITIFGLNFTEPGVQRAAGRGDLRDGKFPLTLACIGVEVAGRRVPVTFVKSDQINAQAPTLDINGPVTVRVIMSPGLPNEVRSDAATVRLQTLSPAFFLLGGSRSIAAQLPNEKYRIVADPNLVPDARPAQPGEWVVLYGTGFGPTEPVYQAGEIVGAPAPLRERFSLTIGGITLRPEEVPYAGLSPGSISGLYQFNVRIPDTVPEGDVPVEVRIGGLSTQSGATTPVRRR